MAAKSKVVEATGAAAGGAALSAKETEDIMRQASLQAQSEGVQDPDEIRTRMLDAVRKMKADRMRAAKTE